MNCFTYVVFIFHLSSLGPRHSVNALAMYEVVRSKGIPDSHIVLMLAGFPATDPRNRFPGRLFMNSETRRNVVGPDVGVDASDLGVNVASFLAVLTGQNHKEGVPQNLRLQSNENSSVLVFLTGHGGDQFLKFHDSEELGSPELGAAISTMHARGRFKELLVLLDTCQAATMTEHIVAPNVLSLASCERGENSYAKHGDPAIGVSTVDRFTAAVVTFMAKRRNGFGGTIQDLYASLDSRHLRSHAVLGNHSFKRSPHEVLCSDFFAAQPVAFHDGDLSAHQNMDINLDALPSFDDPVIRLGRTERRPGEEARSSKFSDNVKGELSLEVYISTALLLSVVFGGALVGLL